jgi:hypothetical protein
MSQAESISVSSGGSLEARVGCPMQSNSDSTFNDLRPTMPLEVLSNGSVFAQEGGARCCPHTISRRPCVPYHLSRVSSPTRRCTLNIGMRGPA